MSTPRDRNDGPDDGAGWREPEHLGGGHPADPPGGTPAPDQPAADQPAPAWEPPGWSLPSAEPERSTRPDAGAPTPADAPPADVPPSGQVTPSDAGPTPWTVPGAADRQPDPDAPVQEQADDTSVGRRRPPPDRVGDQVFRYQGDLVGAQGWGASHGWVPSDGTAPEDAVLAELVASSPVRPSKDDRPGNVLRGRMGTLELVAFDVVYVSGRYAQPRWAVTAAPVLGQLPGFRLSPARFWKHRTGGLLHLPSGDPEFDTRWVLLAPEDTPQLRRLVDDPVVRQLLLGSDDGDELWSAAGHVAAVRPDGHRPELIEHQGRILGAVLTALTALR